MNWIDVVLIIIIAIIVILVIYFGIIKTRKNPCRGCGYAKSCAKKHTCSKDYITEINQVDPTNKE